MKRVLRRDRTALVIAALLALLPLAALAVYLLEQHAWAQRQIDELEPRHARLAGLAASHDALAAAGTTARERLAEFVYPVTQDLTQAGNDAQQRVRTLFTGAGLQVVSSQVLPARDERQFDRIPVSVRTEGEIDGLQRALAALAEQTPAILLDSLTIQTVALARPEAAPRLGSQFTLSVLRLKP